MELSARFAGFRSYQSKIAGPGQRRSHGSLEISGTRGKAKTPAEMSFSYLHIDKAQAVSTRNFQARYQGGAVRIR